MYVKKLIENDMNKLEMRTNSVEMYKPKTGTYTAEAMKIFL